MHRFLWLLWCLGALSLAAAGCDSGSSGDAGDGGGGDGGGFPDLPAGAFTVQLPSEAAPDGGLAVRVFLPATAERRYPEGAPVLVFAPGGHTAGDLPVERPDPDARAHGLVKLMFLMPGGRTPDATSAGSYDYRGPACQRALADVLRYALGEIADDTGQTLQQRVPFALATNVGVLGSSNGGNLVATTLGRHGVELSGLGWAAFWESPIGAQMVTVELGGRGQPLNPFYVPGTCGVGACPWPGLAAALAFDPEAAFTLEDPASGRRVDLRGRLFVDADGDAALGMDELAFSPLGGPGEVIAGLHRPKGYLSGELLAAVEAESARLFPAGWPPWLASRAEVEAYWNPRDGALWLAVAHERLPDLPVIVLGSAEDHVQGQPDHPHVRGCVRGWLDAGHAWVRLNPDAAYLAAVAGVGEARLPDNPAGENAPYPGLEAWLVPETSGATPLDPSLDLAAVLELADRTRAGERSPDLDQVLPR